MKRTIFTGIFLAVLALAGFINPATRPAVAQGGITWQAQFFNNLTLNDSPVFTTQYGSLDLYWGSSAPGSGVNADNFSARFAADPYFAAGTYRFYILADDAVQLWIDSPATSQPALTTFNAPHPGQMLTADVALTAGNHHIQIDFRELTNEAYLYVQWINLATNPTSPSFPATGTTAIGPWTAQYFNNPTLTGAPVAAQVEAAVSHSWGDQAPVAGIPADNFSVRWISVQTLTGGTYDLKVLADDGVRVWMDSTLAIDEWHVSSGQAYTRTLMLSAGKHAFTVEYYEGAGLASIDFTLTQSGGSTPPQPPSSPTGTTATILAYSLNVRNGPSLTAQVLTRVNLNQTYAVIGRNANNTWFQINMNGIIGWVSGAYVRLNNASALPITDGSTTAAAVPPVVSGLIVTARVNLSIRGGPGITYTRLSYLAGGTSAELIGRSAANNWWQIRYGPVTGWISAYYSDLQPGLDITRVPVTG